MVLHSLGQIGSQLLFLLLGVVLELMGLLILLGKQYYLVAGIPLAQEYYSEIEIRKGKLVGRVMIGLGILLLILGFANF